jgi:hypothetical protein
MAGMEQAIDSLEREGAAQSHAPLLEEIRRWREGASATEEEDEDVDEIAGGEELLAGNQEKKKEKASPRKGTRPEDEHAPAHDLVDSMYTPAEGGTTASADVAAHVYSLVDDTAPPRPAAAALAVRSPGENDQGASEDSATDASDASETEEECRSPKGREGHVYEARVTTSAYIDLEEAGGRPEAEVGPPAGGSYYVEVNVDTNDDGEEGVRKKESENAEKAKLAGSKQLELDLAPPTPQREEQKGKDKKQKKTEKERKKGKAKSSSPRTSAPADHSGVPTPPPPPPPPPLAVSLGWSAHSRPLHPVGSNNDIYRYMKKQQKAKGSMIVRPEDRQQYLRERQQTESAQQTKHGICSCIICSNIF